MSDQAGSNSTYTPKGKSLDDIASMMAENTMKMRRQPVPNEVKEPVDAEEDQASVEDQVPAVDGDDGDTGKKAYDPADDEPPVEDKAEDDEEGASEPEPDAADGGDDSGSDAFDFEIDDDTLFALDDDLEVSFKDLKDRYNANEEVSRLAQEQKEVYQEAFVTRQKAIEESQKAREAASAVFEHFDRLISTPLVSEPDKNLRHTDPARYLDHLEYYNQDQERIRQQKTDLTAAFDQHLTQQKEVINQQKQQVLKNLAEALPALKSSDAAVKQRTSQDIMEAATHYGFSEDEVNSALDHRLYVMAHDAQQYRKLMSKQGTVETKEDKETKVKSQTRTLRPRGTTANSRQTAKATRVKAVRAKAAKTGRVNDVADYLAAKKS